MKGKISWKWLVVGVVLLAVIFAGYSYYKFVNRVIPEELIKETLNKTLSVNSYRYQVYFQLEVDGNKRVLSDVKGEKSGKQFHLTGKMLGQDIEIYQLDDVLLLKDSLSGRWMKHPGANVLENELFLAEIDPLASFQISRVIGLQYLGIVKKSDKQYYELEFKADLNNEMLNKFWENFRYKILVEKSSKRIAEAEVTADHKKDQRDKMFMKIKLYDFNEQIVIKEPEQ